jgi:hypothetical protein
MLHGKITQSGDGMASYSSHTKGYSLPNSTSLEWRKADGEKEQPSHVVQMIEQGFAAAQAFGNALLLLDRYFLSVPALVCWLLKY